jgi:hypothetical protein
MLMKKARKATPVDEANTDYWQRQMPLGFAFKSPFAMLNVTLTDCQKQRLELGVSDEDFERDKSTFNKAIDDIIAKHGYPDTNEKVDFSLALAFDFVRGAMTKSDVPQNYWPLVACHAALVTLRDEQQKKSFRVDAAMTNLALFAQGMMNIAWKPARMKQLAELVEGQHTLTNQQQATNKVLNEANKGLLPHAEKGNKFKPGKSEGALSPLAKAVKKILVNKPLATANQVWDTLSAKPPSGLAFIDNARLGRYVEDSKTGEHIAALPAFRNHVSRQRPNQK